MKTNEQASDEALQLHLKENMLGEIDLDVESDPNIDNNNLVAKEDEKETGDAGDIDIKDQVTTFFQDVPANEENIDHWRTGSDAARETWAQIAHVFVEQYPQTQEDIMMFEKYLTANLKAYFNKFEDEISGPVETDIETELDGEEEGDFPQDNAMPGGEYDSPGNALNRDNLPPEEVPPEPEIPEDPMAGLAEAEILDEDEDDLSVTFDSFLDDLFGE